MEKTIVCVGDILTLYSIDNDEIIEFKVGDRSFPGLDNLCLGKTIKDQISYCGEVFVIQYIVQANKNSALHVLSNKGSVSGKNFNKNHSIDIHDFIVRTNVYKCTYSNHKLIPVNAMVHIIDSGIIREIPFPGMYCEKCKKYFIYERTYQEMKNMGYICCKIIQVTDLEEYNNKNSAFDLWQNKSILNLYGYSVDRNKNLSQKERHEILAFIIENNILSTNKIVDYLQSFISLRKNNKSMHVAIDKWQADISYVLKYKKGTSNIRINSITIHSKKGNK